MKEFLTTELIGKTSRLLSNNLSLKFTREKLGLTTEQWIILQILSNGSKSQKELGEITLKNKASINSLISNLLKLSFVTKIVSKTDKRKTIISTTAIGDQIMNKANKLAYISVKQALDGFLTDEVNQLNEYLNRINNNLLKEK
jgi:DNA-binding MarR family transcriptional regulator